MVWLTGHAQSSAPSKPLHRTGREIHYPPEVDVSDPYILLVHQGMVEDVFLKDMAERNVGVIRSCPFVKYQIGHDPQAPIEVVCDDNRRGLPRTFKSRYLAGCEGAHSKVRKSMPGVQMQGESSNAHWGVLDGTIF